jgi:hypothetical protein
MPGTRRDAQGGFVKRPFRILLNAATVLSLVSCVAAVLLGAWQLW